MANAIAAAAISQDDSTITALVGPQTPEWETGIPWHPRLDKLPELPDLLIDFSLPDGTLAAANWCGASRIPLLSGVTGLSNNVFSALKQAAWSAPVLWSPNLSIGVNLLADLAARASAVLGPGVPVEIEDIHHQWKKDAPSGTALMLGGRIGEARGDDEGIDYRSERQGEVVGVHTVSFRLKGEAFDLVHRAHDRSIYALGALDAGAWLVAQPPGLYAARDWLSGRG